ncbi:MAG TPA: hypothetical protein VGX91_10610 [Candidatus Cybelea sp.]|jgi:hypothetical protein|nr:hypothetical protein [Candidatus Cybelea sp.]
MRLQRSLATLTATILLAAMPLAASAQFFSVGVGFGGPGWGVGVSAGYPPPALPYYTQPVATYPGYQWTPGYWAWGSYGYYWVPGAWVAPPVVGDYWTPGYWGYLNGAYSWYPGYWGPTVGFYGGINYGYGYFGTGFVGGYWSGGAFNYNTAVMNVNRTVIHNTYVNRTVIRHGTISSSRTSFNGGPHGVRAHPTSGQIAARRAGVRATAAQRAHQRVAAHDRGMLAAVNHGHPRAGAPHAITAADRHTALHQMHASTMHHGTLAAAHHGAPSTASHHSGTIAATHHSPNVGLTSGHSSHSQVGMRSSGRVSAPSHGAASYHAPSHGSIGGGRPPGGFGGGHPGGGSIGGHPGGGGRPPRG